MHKRTSYLILSFLLGCLFIAAVQPTPKPKPKPKAKSPAPRTQVKKAPDAVRIRVPVGEKVQLVEISTRFGRMVVRLYNETPLHRDNFIKLVKDSFYNDLLFHRVIPDFMIQGGDPTSREAAPAAMLGKGGPGYTVPAELNQKLFHRPGALAAARDNNPGKASSGSQFYIVQGKTFLPDELIDIQNSTNLANKKELLSTITASDSVQAKLQDYMTRGDKEGMNAYFTSLQPAIDKIFEKMELKFSPEQIQVYTKQGGAPFLDMNYTVFGEVIDGYQVIDSIAALKRDKFDRPLQDTKMRIRLIN
jgi:cyclophilin family peptidyl-prolyl cis-trans isomerase